MKIYHNQIFQQYIFVAYLNPTKRIMDAIVMENENDAKSASSLVNFLKIQKAKIVDVTTECDAAGKIIVGVEVRSAEGGKFRCGAVLSNQKIAADFCEFIKYVFKD